MVLAEKRDRFSVSTIVKVIWSFAKIDFEGSQTTEVIRSFATYQRLIDNLPGLTQKNQVILLWTFSRDNELLKNEIGFVEKVLDGMIQFQS